MLFITINITIHFLFVNRIRQIIKFEIVIVWFKHRNIDGKKKTNFLNMNIGCVYIRIFDISSMNCLNEKILAYYLARK